MLKINLDESTGIAILEPHGALSAEDFQKAAKVIDAHIEKKGALNGVIIHVESFPGWDSFSALVKHLEFIKNHHREVKRVAFATDSALGAFAEKIAGHFVKAEVREFPFAELEQAKEWIMSAA